MKHYGLGYSITLLHKDELETRCKQVWRHDKEIRDSAVHSISRKDDQKKIELFFISTQLHSKSHDLSYELCLFDLLNSISQEGEQEERVLITKFV